MTPADRQAARDKIAALRSRWERAQALKARYASYVTTLEESAAHDKYLVALESLVDELTAPEPEDLTRDLERSITKLSVERACGISKNVRRAR